MENYECIVAIPFGISYICKFQSFRNVKSIYKSSKANDESYRADFKAFDKTQWMTFV